MQNESNPDRITDLGFNVRLIYIRRETSARPNVTTVTDSA